jgi:hypothetical protein
MFLLYRFIIKEIEGKWLKQLTKFPLTGIGVTALFVVIIILFMYMASPLLVSSQGLSTYKQADPKTLQKRHEDKIDVAASDDPFRFPMPLWELDNTPPGPVDSNLQGKDQPNRDSASGVGHSLKQSTFKATVEPDKKMIKKIIDNVSIPLSDNSRKSDLTLNNLSASNKNISVPLSTTKDSSKIYSLYINGNLAPVKYQLSGNSNKLLNISMENDNATLLVHLSSNSPGTLWIELARNIIDSKSQEIQTDSSFAVFEDGVYKRYEEIEKNNYARQLMMEFGNGTRQIAIVGTHASPEFHDIAGVLYGVSMTIVAIIIVLARSNGLRVKFFDRR